MKLAGKKALITGGNSGIGLATARLFVAEGAQVAISGRDQKTLDEALQELGPQAVGYRADVTDLAAYDQMFSALGERFGHLDVVFANAGIGGSTPVGTADEELFEKIIRVNLVGAFLTANRAVPLLKDGGSLIFTGSVIGSLGQTGYAAYAASKAGLRGMARALASDLAPRGIRVNLVSPGATRTPIWKRRKVTEEQTEAFERRLSSVIPFGRLGEADEVAKVVLFLASEDAAYVNSVELFVDGGNVGSPYGGPAFRG